MTNQKQKNALSRFLKAENKLQRTTEELEAAMTNYLEAKKEWYIAEEIADKICSPTD